jgi:hypothetical protein
MSGLFDDIVDIGKSIFGGDGLGSTLAKTALAGYALSQVTNSVTAQDAGEAAADPKDAAAVDKGVRQQSDASTDNTIPVVYGSAFLGGKVFDAYMTPDNTTMWFALAICEQTGPIASLSFASRIGYEAVYWNGNRVVWGAGNQVAGLYNESSGQTTTDPADLIEIYLFNGNGLNDPSRLLNDKTRHGINGKLFMPNWTSTQNCEQLCYALVKVIYNKEKNITGLGDLKFHVVNRLNDPGDVLLDYMTNTRYGAGITAGDINA